jgi:hypothetical protein
MRSAGPGEAVSAAHAWLRAPEFVILRSVPQMESPMSTELNKQVVLESFRVLETGDAVVADRIVAPDFINREADDDPDRPDRGLRGPAGLIATSRWLSETFSDLRFDLHEGWLRRANALLSWRP